ncbi:MAG: TonB-dependent receptor [Gemmatimonadota bacterium]
MTIHRIPTLALLIWLSLPLLGALTGARALHAQEPPHLRELEGVVLADDTGRPLAGAAVMLPVLSRTALTHGDGTYHLREIPPGTYTIRAELLGYAPLEVEVEVVGQGDRVVLRLEPAPLTMDGLVVSAGVTERDRRDVLQSTNVLGGEELQRRLQETVAATLASEPGVSATSMGPATARPVIRGLSGDRVLLLEDGVRVGDVSNAGADHATALDPASARRVEVVRGPASILYGANALGGVVNVIRDEIPTEVPHHFTGAAVVQGRSVNEAFATNVQSQLGITKRIPVRIESGGRPAGDLQTPVGPLDNTGIGSWNAGVGTSYVGDDGHVGAAFRMYRNDYGIPGGFVGGHVNGVNVEMERYSSKLQGRYRFQDGPFSSVEARGTYTWYRHREIEPPDILGTLFRLQTLSGNVLARHDGWGPFTSGAVGARAARESFQFGGALFTPDSRRLSLAAFTFQEIEFDAFRIEAGLRYDWARATPLEADPDSDIGVIEERTFSAASGSLGFLFDATDAITVGVNAARAFRTPDVNELYSEGPHLAAYAFEVGNPQLGTEIGTGVDAFVRYGDERLSAEATVFYNDISGYIYPRETGDTSRVELPIFQFQGEDAVLQGWEVGADWAPWKELHFEGAAAAVRGTLSETGEPLPLIPPIQGRRAIAWEPEGWFVRGETVMASRQDRLGEFETATDGYAIFEVAAGIRLTLGGRRHVITATLENLTDEEYRNHLSRVKEIMPEAGRGLSVTYRVVF